MPLDSKILKLLQEREIQIQINDHTKPFDEAAQEETFKIIKKGLFKNTEPTTKTILLLRSLPDQPPEVVEEQRAILWEASKEQNFQIIEIFYYILGDLKQREKIIRYIKALGEKVALVTNHINPQTSYKKGKKLFKRLVKQNYIDVYKLINGQLCLVYSRSTQIIRK